MSKLQSFVGASVAMAAAQALGQQAVEWKVSEGGNGHWYGVVITGPIPWSEARIRAEALGGHLATFSNSIEEDVIWPVVANPDAWNSGAGPYLGAFQIPGSCEPGCGWRWVTTDPWDYHPWAPGEPNNSCAGKPEDVLHYAAAPTTTTPARRWNDWAGDGCDGYKAIAFVMEWEADCNGDGTVDYGQILSGELADTSGNGVPDCCETGEPCNAQNLLLSGGFEAGTPLAACSSESAAAPNTLAPGWQVSAGRVDRVRAGSPCATSTQPKFGDYCIDLCGTPASSGAIKQLVPTIPGHKYRCTFWLSGDASTGPAIKKVHAKVGTYVDLSYTFTCSGTGAQNWVSNQFEFTARGANEPLEFVADNGVTTGGPMLDAINLIDITTQCVGDIDGSGDVDGADIALLLLNFGPCPSAP